MGAKAVPGHITSKRKIRFFGTQTMPANSMKPQTHNAGNAVKPRNRAAVLKPLSVLTFIRLSLVDEFAVAMRTSADVHFLSRKNCLGAEGVRYTRLSYS